MVAMGFWQLDRLDTKKKLNQEVEDRATSAIVPITEVVVLADPWSIGETVKFRRATAEGQYQDEDSVLVRNRSLNGAPGYWLLTPLLVSQDAAVVVNRGWLPISAESFSPKSAGQVSISGLIQETKGASGLQRNDPKDGVLQSLGRVDLERYQKQLDYKIFPIYIQLEVQDPDNQDPTIPIKLGIPDFDEGPHLNYAIQWFCFATVFSIGYPIVLWRNKQKNKGGEPYSEIPIDYL